MACSAPGNLGDKNTPFPGPGVVADAEQNIRWDGTGGVTDTFDYDGINSPNGEQTDALANGADLLFGSVTANTSALIFSTDADPRIYSESIGGAAAIWATPAMIDQHGVDDVDGLEVWGPEPPDFGGGGGGFGGFDEDRYSLMSDAASGVSVWNGTTGAAYIAQTTIISAVTSLLGPVPDGLEPFDIDQIGRAHV